MLDGGAASMATLLAGEDIVSRSGEVYTQKKMDDELDRLDLANDIAKLELASANDEQVRQRQDAVS